MAGRFVRLLVVVVLGFSAAGVWGQQAISPELKEKIDSAVKREMAATGVPSASVGAVQGGKVIYTGAYGMARLPATDSAGKELDKGLAASPEMHYAIGSISKQFTTACILLLAERGKLTLDDPVSRWFPELTRAKDVKIKNLLTHTSGYEDYAPQDYTIPLWMKPTKPIDIIHEWAEKPLDFEPGTKWEYSNTNFVLAGLIVEKAGGLGFWEFLDSQVLQPLKLENVLNLDTDREKMEPLGYIRNALGPLRPAVLEAPGWYTADATMAMPVETLLKWDISMIDRTLLKAASYDALEMEMKLKDGSPTQYGLGVQVATRAGHRVVFHSGEVGGFVAANAVYPDDKIAVAVLTNQEASQAANRIQRAVAAILLPPNPIAVALTSAPAEGQVRSILTGLQQGKIDRSLFTPDCNYYFSEQAIADFESSLAPFGEVQTVSQTAEVQRGGMTFRTFAVMFENGTRITITTYTTADGKLEQFLVEGRS
jgi:CubicO group peptidase (beta-lactamase class C family)